MLCDVPGFLFTSTIKLTFSNGVAYYSEKKIPILRYISTHFEGPNHDCKYCDAKNISMQDLEPNIIDEE